MTMKGINHVGIAVVDMDKTVSFYTEVLGLSMSREYNIKARNLRIVFLQVGNQELELLQYDYVEPSEKGQRAHKNQGINHIALEVDDIKSYIPKLKEQGVEFIDQEPRDVFGGPMKILDFWGPDQVIIELYQSK